MPGVGVWACHAEAGIRLRALGLQPSLAASLLQVLRARKVGLEAQAEEALAPEAEFDARWCCSRRWRRSRKEDEGEVFKALDAASAIPGTARRSPGVHVWSNA